MKQKNGLFKKNKKTVIITVGLLIIVGLVLGILEKTQVINLYSDKNSKSPSDGEAKTTSTAPTAQENFSDGDERQIPNSNRNEGVVQDLGGAVGPIPPQSQWTVSGDGSITAYSPAKNSLVKSGDTISGKTTYNQVSFRLIDDVSGVISQGSLKVVNGNFSGRFDFSTTASNGRLDLFYASYDGVEQSNVEIPVRFK